MSIGDMSISGTVMIAAIVVIRALAINRLPKKTFPVLWGIALVRLLVPYSLPSALSVYSLAERLAPAAEDGAYLSATRTISVSQATGVAAAPFPSDASGAPTPSVDPWTVVWLIGVAVCAAFFAVAYWKCRRQFRESLPIENDFLKSWLTSRKLRRTIAIRQTDRISAPLTYGVFHPVILLPKRVNLEDETALTYVLSHEYVHICRFDALTKLVLTAAVCVHWFNPAVWIMYVLANRDMELSCDEAVVRLFGERAKSAYAMALIRMEETRCGFTPLYNHFSKNAIEERIIAIMKIKKTSWAAALAALVLVVGVVTVFATSAQPVAADPVEALVDSLRYADGAVSFQVPLDIGEGAIDVRVYGRAEYDDGFSRSVHELDDVEILPGETYSVTYDPAYTEWWMDIFYQEQYRVVDLLPLINKNGTANTIQTVTGDNTAMSYIDPADGKTYYSVDDGKTWTAMTDEELTAFGLNGVEWWTAEEYAAWLEQEKIDIQAIIGSRGWTPSTGWFTWTQEMADETIAQYERTLKDIQGGMKISKPAQDGDTMLQLSCDPEVSETATESMEIYSSEDDSSQELSPERLAEYEAFGLTCDGSAGVLYYSGEPVRCFNDSADIDGNIATSYLYWNGEGTVDIHTVRHATRNPDGSYDPFGKLTAIEEYKAGELDIASLFSASPESAASGGTAQESADQSVQAVSVATGDSGATESDDIGTEFMENIARYAPFGVTFVKSGNFGNLYWNGELIDVLIDHSPDGGYMTISSADEGGIKLQTVYDSDGTLTGVIIAAD